MTPPTERPTPGQDADGRELLLTAAERLFAEESYTSVTVAKICAQAGMATGTFYAWFESKHELFVELVRSINRDVRRAMAVAIGEATSREDVERLGFQAFFEVMSNRPGVYRIVREAEFVDPSLFREYYEQIARGYARGVRGFQQSGQVDPALDPEIVAFMYMGVGYFVGMRWAEWTQGRSVPDDVQADVMKVLTRGLARPED